jgi:hypothetical protein
MYKSDAIENYTISIESRLAKAEATVSSMKDDIKEIKRNIRWLIGVIFSLNTSILGMLSKLLNIF